MWGQHYVFTHTGCAERVSFFYYMMSEKPSHLGFDDLSAFFFQSAYTFISWCITAPEIHNILMGNPISVDILSIKSFESCIISIG